MSSHRKGKPSVDPIRAIVAIAWSSFLVLKVGGVADTVVVATAVIAVVALAAVWARRD